ncbi:MAG: hypothetical protein VX392_04360 [Verrucomicrobiota bacterium]|nr:hypothetical protein [Verrucomicrobiota bacterium]
MRRLVFPVILLFWLVMNVLLWRAEYGDTGRGSRVSSDVVIDKIFNAPDASSLQVFQNGRSLGFIRWEIIPDEVYFGGTNQPVGRVESIRGYTVALDGRLDVEPLQRKLRFNLRSTLDAAFDWQIVHATINLPPSSWDVTALATNQMLTVKHEGALGQWERTTQLGQLRDPATALESFGGPLVVSLLKPLLPGNLVLGQMPARPPALGLEWVAYNDAIRLGSTRVRIYRIEAKLPGDRPITVFVSRVGEILQVKMPGQLQITNENIPLREGDEI